MIASLLGAFQFLTTIPIRSRTASLGASAAWFPFVGFVLGSGGALLLQALRGFFPITICALLLLSAWALLTGGLHEDGFADVADAIRASRTPGRMLEILKDSRIGVHGALALLLIILVRWQALSSTGPGFLFTIPAVVAVSRGSLTVLAWIARPAGSGLAAHLSQTLTTHGALFAIAQSLAAGVLVGPRLGALLLGGAAIIVLCARFYFERRIGGVTGDCLGATGFLIETYGFLLLSCQPCI